MKKLLFTSFTFIALITFSTISYSQDKIISQNDLHADIKKFISTHFKDHTILKAKEDKERNSMKYKVKLTDNTKLEFDSNYKIIEIDSKGKVPESVVPAAILAYVKANYPNNYITDWELKGANQQVELNNGLELEFNMKGDFLSIDK